MADESILGLLGSSDLSAFNQSVLQSDPYGAVSRSLASWQPDATTWSPAENVGTNFAKAFLSGILGNYAQSRAADQTNAVANVLPQLRANPLSVATPEGVDPAPFALLRATQVIKKDQRDALLDEQKKSGISDLWKTVVGEGVKAGTISPIDALEAAETGDYNKLFSGKADAGKNPNSNQYKVDQDLFKIEQGYTDKLLSGPEPQRVMAINRASTNILDAIKKNNPLAASTAIFEFAKLNDPAGTVREGDELRVSDPGGPLGQLAKIHNELIGGGKLTDGAKKSMRELVPILQRNTFREYDQLRDQYLDAAKGYGANPDRIKYLKPTDLTSFLMDDTPEIPPGMKLQRNKVTGETRIVPQ